MLGNIAAWFTGALEGVLDVPAFTSEHDNGLIDLQCGRTVFNDVPSKMRTELWMSQLQRKRGAAAEAIARYPRLATTALHPDVISEIEKDTHRTYPKHLWLSGPVGQLSLFRILRAYAAFDPEIGYTQGMNFLAGLLLAYLEEPQAFGAMVVVMHERGLRDLYRPDDGMALLQVRLWQLGRLLPPRLAAHLEANAALPVLYASSWFLTCFAADFPMHFAARVMDLVITDCYAAPLMKVAVHLVERCEPELLLMDDLEEMVDLLRRQAPRWPKGKLQDLLTEALGRGWTVRQNAVLREINGAESVADAVARVDAALAASGGLPGSEFFEQPVKNEERSSGFMKDGVAETSPSPQRPKSAAAIMVGSTSSQPATTGVADSQAEGAGASSTHLSGGRKKPLPLPPPPTSRSDKVEWHRWRPSTPALKSLPSDSIRIDTELHDASLDPSFSKELSTYLNTVSAAAMSRRSPTGVEKGETEELERMQNQQEGEEKIKTKGEVGKKEAEPTVELESIKEEDQSITVEPQAAAKGAVTTASKPIKTEAILSRVLSPRLSSRTSNGLEPSPFSGRIPSPFETSTASSAETHSTLSTVFTADFSEFAGAGATVARDGEKTQHQGATPPVAPSPTTSHGTTPEQHTTGNHGRNTTIRHTHNDVLTNENSSFTHRSTANSVTGLLADMSIRTIDYSWPSSKGTSPGTDGSAPGKEESRGGKGSPGHVESRSVVGKVASPAQQQLKPVSEESGQAEGHWEPSFPQNSGFASFPEAGESFAGGKEESGTSGKGQTTPVVPPQQQPTATDKAARLQQAHLQQFFEEAKTPMKQ